MVWENLEPNFVDIDKDYLTLDENKVLNSINENTSAIL